MLFKGRLRALKKILSSSTNVESITAWHFRVTPRASKYFSSPERNINNNIRGVRKTGVSVSSTNAYVIPARFSTELNDLRWSGGFSPVEPTARLKPTDEQQ